MTEKKHWRKPSWQIVIATLAGVFFLSSLGVWQLQRAEEKKQIQLEYESRKNSEPQTFSFPITDPASLRFQRIRVQGRFISNKQFVLDNRYLDHQVGFNILTPFKLDDSDKVVLVDRGWLPLKGPREELPIIDVDENFRTLVSTVYVPYGKAFSLGEIDHSISWPRLIQYLDFKELGMRLGHELLPLTLRMEENQADTYKAQWIVYASSPKRNYGYAFQWLAMALALLVIFIVLHRPR
ncbi:MAG: SURF1 family protein [Gammaproteobacteria bacterium]|nr:SURF1 family protein [Gammaproteobacteria bacterium]MBT8124802.1 SURF1 family protein [Gammaproteobacteria bacterium]